MCSRHDIEAVVFDTGGVVVVSVWEHPLTRHDGHDRWRLPDVGAPAAHLATA